MFKNNKKIIYIIVAILAVIIIAVGTIFILQIINNGNKNNTVTTIAPTKTKADDLKSLALKAINDGNIDQAKTLLNQANQQYKGINDKIGIAYTDAQLWLVNHLPPQPATSSSTASTAN